MSEFILPKDDKIYLLQDNFNRPVTGQDLVGDSPSYSSIGAVWQDSDSATVGWITTQSGGKQYASWGTTSTSSQVVNIDTGQNTLKTIRAELEMPATNGRIRIFIRKSSADVDRGQATSAGVMVYLKNNVGSLESRFQVENAGGTDFGGTNFADHGDSVNGYEKFAVLIEDTGTTIKVTIGGVTREATIPDLTGVTAGGFIGFTGQLITDKVHKVQVW